MSECLSYRIGYWADSGCPTEATMRQWATDAEWLERELVAANAAGERWWRAAVPYATPSALREALLERRWIPVAEKLPNEGQMVLAFWPASATTPISMESVTFLTDGAANAWRDAFDEDAEKPSHWMPLPEAPK